MIDHDCDTMMCNYMYRSISKVDACNSRGWLARLYLSLMYAGLKYRWHLAIVSSVSSAHISAYSTATQTLQTWELLTKEAGSRNA